MLQSLLILQRERSSLIIEVIGLRFHAVRAEESLWIILSGCRAVLILCVSIFILPYSKQLSIPSENKEKKTMDKQTTKGFILRTTDITFRTRSCISLNELVVKEKKIKNPPWWDCNCLFSSFLSSSSTKSCQHWLLELFSRIQLKPRVFALFLMDYILNYIQKML